MICILYLCAGIGVVMIITQLLQLFRLHPTIGSLYVAIRTCIAIVLSFILTFLIITVAFALGLHFVLKHSREVCDQAGNPSEGGISYVNFSLSK